MDVHSRRTICPYRSVDLKPNSTVFGSSLVNWNPYPSLENRHHPEQPPFYHPRQPCASFWVAAYLPQSFLPARCSLPLPPGAAERRPQRPLDPGTETPEGDLNGVPFSPYPSPSVPLKVHSNWRRKREKGHDQHPTHLSSPNIWHLLHSIHSRCQK